MGIASILIFLKDLFRSGDSKFSEITPALLSSQKSKLDFSVYSQWLRRKTAELVSIKAIQNAKGISTPDSWDEKLELLNKELEEVKKFG